MTDHDLQATDQGPRADRPKRRTFTPAYKLRIVEAYDNAPAGEKGALLRLRHRTRRRLALGAPARHR